MNYIFPKQKPSSIEWIHFLFEQKCQKFQGYIFNGLLHLTKLVNLPTLGFDLHRLWTINHWVFWLWLWSMYVFKIPYYKNQSPCVARFICNKIVLEPIGSCIVSTKPVRMLMCLCGPCMLLRFRIDRKSTRLNSSH